MHAAVLACGSAVLYVLCVVVLACGPKQPPTLLFIERCEAPSIIRRSSLVVRPSSFIIRHPSSAIRRPSFVGRPQR